MRQGVICSEKSFLVWAYHHGIWLERQVVFEITGILDPKVAGYQVSGQLHGRRYSEVLVSQLARDRIGQGSSDNFQVAEH